MVNPNNDDDLTPSLKNPNSRLKGAIEDLSTAIAADSQALRAIGISRASSGLLNAALEAAGDPEQTELLIESMLRGTSEELRKVSRLALEGSSDPRAQRALRVDEIMSQLDGAWHVGYGVLAGVPDNHKELTGELEKFTEDPLFVDRMLESVLTRQIFAREIALVLRTTSCPEKQSEFRAILEKMIGSETEWSKRDDLAYLPLALDPESAKSQELFIRLLTEGARSSEKQFEANVVKALAEFRNPMTQELFLKTALSIQDLGDIGGQSAIALRDHMSPEVKAVLMPFVQGSMLDTAIALADYEGERGLKKLLSGLNSRFMQNKVGIRELRARAAVALADAEPGLSRKVLAETENPYSPRLKFARRAILSNT